LETNEKPILDTAFISKHMKIDMPPGGENTVYSSMRLVEDAEKDCIAFMITRHDDPHFIKIAEILKKRHESLPDDDPQKLNESQIEKEVRRYRLNELADKAIEKGVKLLISHEPIKNYPCLLVPNVRSVLLYLLKQYVKMFNVNVIQVTGSYGKTSACQFVYDMLGANDKIVHRNRENGNDYRGLVNAIARLENKHEFYVQETQEAPIAWMASAASKILTPKVGIITNAGASHLQFLKTKENVAHACLGIQDGISNDDGLLLINADDNVLRKKLRKPKTSVVSYGIHNKKADCLAENIDTSYDGISFEIVYKSERYPLKVAALGEFNVYNALSAFITGRHIGLNDDEIIKGISSYKSKGIRQNLVEIKGRTFYIDCYSATPETMAAAVTLISNTNVKSKNSRRIAVLGNINALGSYNKQGHEEVGHAVLNSNIDILICSGHNAAIIADVAKERANLKVIKVFNFEHLVETIQEETRADDLVLLKAGREADLEHALDFAFGTYFTLESEEYYKNAAQLKRDDYYASFFERHTTITKYIGDAVDLVMPRTVHKRVGSSMYNSVFGIGTKAFYGNETLRSVVLPNCLKVISTEAFGNCKELTKVVIPQSVVNIEKDAFINSNIVIHGERNSFAEEYAQNNDIPFEEITSAASISNISFVSAVVTGNNDNRHLNLINDEHPFTGDTSSLSLAKAELMLPVLKIDTVYAQEIVIYMTKQLLAAAKKYAIDGLYIDSPCKGSNYDDEYVIGLAIDIVSKGSKHSDESDNSIHEWLENNAYRFGFNVHCLKENEAWHLRYVGRVNAYYIKTNNLGLEEYLNLIKEKKELTVDMYGAIFKLFYQIPEDNMIKVPSGFYYSISSDNLGGYIIEVDTGAVK